MSLSVCCGCWRVGLLPKKQYERRTATTTTVETTTLREVGLITSGFLRRLVYEQRVINVIKSALSSPLLLL